MIKKIRQFLITVIQITNDITYLGAKLETVFAVFRNIKKQSAQHCLNLWNLSTIRSITAIMLGLLNTAEHIICGRDIIKVSCLGRAWSSTSFVVEIFENYFAWFEHGQNIIGLRRAPSSTSFLDEHGRNKSCLGRAQLSTFVLVQHGQIIFTWVEYTLAWFEHSQPLPFFGQDDRNIKWRFLVI